MADQTLEAFGQPNKGLSWGELIVDNILGLDNEYESFGEKLGKAINEDEIKFLKDAAVGVYEGTKEFVQAPVETTKQVVNEIKDSVTRLGSEDLNTRLQRMYGVSYDQATDEQVNQAREAVLGDALTALELVPAAKVTTTVAGAAIPSGLKADVVGQTKAMLSGDREFLSGTPTPKADAQPAGAQVPGMFTPREKPKPEVAPASYTNTETFDDLYDLSVAEGVPELRNQDASFYSNLISPTERYQIKQDFATLAFEGHANYGDEYNVMYQVTDSKAYDAYTEDLADQIEQEVGRIFKEKLELIDAGQLLRLAALQRMHKQNGLQEGSNSAAEIMDLAEGIRQTLNLTNSVRVNGPEAYIGNQPLNARVKILAENGSIVDRKVSDLKFDDGKYRLKDLLGLGSENRLNERFESIILDIVDSDDFLTPNSEIYVGDTPQTFKSYVDYVIDTEDSFFNQTPYKGADQTFKNINVEVLDEFLKKTSNKPVPLTGSRILSILQNDPRVNSKNIPKAIFEAEKDNVFDPSQAKELLELYSFQVKPKSQDNFSRFQRQVNEGLAIGIPKGYNELTLNVDPDNAAPAIQPNRMHFDKDTLVHTRYTIMEPDAPNLSDETRELLGDEDFILVEELQSDLLSGGYKSYKKLDFESLVNNTMRGTTGPDARIYEQVLKNQAGTILSRYFDDFEKFAIKKFDDKYNNGIDVNSREYIKKGDQLIDSLSDEHEEWLKTSYPNATEEQLNTALVNFRSSARNFLYDMADDEGKLHDAVLRMGSKTRNQAEINVEALEDPFLFGTPPIKKNIEGVELNLQNLISRASQLGINKIVIPPFEKIASARFYGEELDLALKNQVMDKDGNIKTGHRLYQTYVTDLEKALKKFEQSYPIKVNRDVDIPYQGQNSLSALPDIKYSDGLDIKMLKGIVIDISDMSKKFDLENPRFAEGGSVRPKLRPEGFANATSPKPRLRPSGNEVRYLDAVFRGEDGDIVTSPEENNPVTMLGLTRGDTFRQYPKDNLNVKGLYFIPTDEGEGGPTESKMQDFYSREKPDSPPLLIDDILIAGRRGVEDRYTAAHEFMHRGFNVLRSNHSFDEVKERFGRATAQILFSERPDLEHALVQAVLEKEGKIAGIDYEGYDYLKGASKETRDKLKKSVEDIYELSNETLGEAGYQTDRDRGPTTRQGRRGAKPKSFWSFITEKLGFAEGGTVDMNQQMSFAFEDGGLRDDGMMRDPVSGNEVPPGSTAKEVRDDIPAQLSEGEYVVPADVVRYYGVKFFEDLRDNAKMGLQDMEARGRIGGEPVPAGGPMDGDLSPEELAAIQEMMGMAEGGVVNMYKQQQDLYSPPNPAIGNPTTTGMASGGEVRGYNSSSVVTNPMTDQSVLEAGQQAQQRGFVGFPLGATIFPSATTGKTVLGPSGTQVATTGNIGQATTGTTGTTTTTDTSALTTVTLYGPNGEIITLTLPTDTDRYNQLLSEGWTTEMPVAGTQKDDTVQGKEGPDTDPSSWMDKFDYRDFDKLKDQTSENLTRIPFAGALGALGNATKAAQSAANIIVMKANGFDTSDLEKELNKFKKENGLNLLPNEFINGDRLALDIIRNNPGADLGIDKKATDLEGNFIFKSKGAWDDFMQEIAPPNMTYNPATESYVSDGSSGGGSGTLIETTPSGVNVYRPGPDTLRPVLRGGSTTSTVDSGPSTQSEKTAAAKSAANDWVAATQAVQSTSTDDPKAWSDAIKAQSEASKAATKAIKEASGWGTDNYNPNWRDAAEGGLMTTEKPKKKTRKYNKGGLAGKK
jgi:hypothetical protein